MKKYLSIILSVVLCLSLVVAMAGCRTAEGEKIKDKVSSEQSTVEGGSQAGQSNSQTTTAKTPAELLIGKWVYEINLSKMGMGYEEMFQDEEAFEGLDMEFPDLVFSAYYEFDANSKMTLSIDEASLDKMIKGMKVVVTQAVEKVYADEIAQTGINVQQVVDGLLAGVSADSFKQMMGSDSLSTNYRIEGNIIYASMDGEEESGVEFEVSETTLKLTSDGETVELKRK